MPNPQEDVDVKFAATMSEITDAISHSIKGVLEKAKATKDDLADVSDEDKVKITAAKDIKERQSKWANYFLSNGSIDGFNKVSIQQMVAKSNQLAAEAKDAVTSQWYRNMIPNVVSNIIREPISLGNPLTGLLTSVRFSAGTSITFPAVGASGNINCDMGESEEYPELDLDMSGSVTATIGKSGIAVSFTEECIRYSAFDVVAMHARQAVDVLRRHKEKKAAAMIFGIGSTFIDNDVTSARHSKGRNMSMIPNKTLIIDDLIDASLDALREGWRLDTIIVHPMAWQIFAKDPILREQFFRGLAGGQFFNGPNGSPANYPQLGVNNPYGKNIGPSTAVGFSNIAAGSLSFVVPGYAGFGFNVIVSNYAPISFDSVTGNYKTDIAMIQADQAGLLIIDEDLMTEDWKDPARDVMKMKFRERYSLANVNQGKAGRILKNIQIAQAFFAEDKVIWDLATQPLPNQLSSSSS